MQKFTHMFNYLPAKVVNTLQGVDLQQSPDFWHEPKSKVSVKLIIIFEIISYKNNILHLTYFKLIIRI